MGRGEAATGEDDNEVMEGGNVRGALSLIAAYSEVSSDDEVNAEYNPTETKGNNFDQVISICALLQYLLF